MPWKTQPGLLEFLELAKSNDVQLFRPLKASKDQRYHSVTLMLLLYVQGSWQIDSSEMKETVRHLATELVKQSNSGVNLSHVLAIYKNVVRGMLDSLPSDELHWSLLNLSANSFSATNNGLMNEQPCLPSMLLQVFEARQSLLFKSVIQNDALIYKYKVHPTLQFDLLAHFVSLIYPACSQASSQMHLLEILRGADNFR